MTPQKSVAREQLFRYFFFGVLALILWQLLRVFSPFLTGFLWATILTLMFYPMHAWMLRRKAMSENMAALVSTLCVLLIFILPMIFFSWILVKESTVVYPAVREWAEGFRNMGEGSAQASVPDSIRPYWEKTQGILEPMGLDLKEMALKNLDQITARITEAGARAVKNFLLLLFNLLVLVISLFLLFRHGAPFILWGVDLLPMEPTHKRHILDQVYMTFGAVVRGILLVAVIQGFMSGFGFWAAGVRFPVLLGAACIFAALIPVGGTSLVWGPICAYMIYKGIPHGIALLLWCIIMVGMLDNVLKAWIIGSQVKIPILLLFIALLGGMMTYGFVGVLLGPMLVTCALALLRIYREEYHLRLPITEPGARPSS